MGAGTLIQIVFDIFIAAGFFTIVMRMNRAPKDDPRLSRGLQLLQSKISVLEDLSDRTENQVNQLVAILENKGREVQAKVQLAEQTVHEIRLSMERSLEVAKIFQDKIPHKEIIERQNTIKYVQAARLAHQGVSVDEIATQTGLPKGEVEFIASVNRDRLMFSEDQLPDWVRESAVQVAPIAPANAEGEQARVRAELELAEQQRLVENLSRLQSEMQSLDIQLARENNVRDMAAAFEAPQVDTSTLKKLGAEFRKAVEEGDRADHSTGGFFPPLEQLSSLIPHVVEAAENIVESAAQASAKAQIMIEKQVTPFIFEPSINADFANDGVSNGGNETFASSIETAPQAHVASQETAQMPSQTATQRQSEVKPAQYAQPAQPEAPRDPVLARSVAQQKVQAALRTSAVKPVAPKTSEELEAARALAREASKGTLTPAPAAPLKSKSPVINPSRNASESPVIRKVVFPRIDESEA